MAGAQGPDRTRRDPGHAQVDGSVLESFHEPEKVLRTVREKRRETVDVAQGERRGRARLRNRTRFGRLSHGGRGRKRRRISQGRYHSSRGGRGSKAADSFGA